MTVKTPTPQRISRLLREAGFPRSDYGDKGVMRSEASTGFSVWKTYHRDSPQQPYIAVQHVVKGAWFADDDWPEIQREMRARLEEYAEVVRAASYHALIRNRGQEPPWLTILTLVKDG